MSEPGGPGLGQFSDLVGIGGCLSLDFLNTISSRGTVWQRDRLSSYEDLADWSLATGALTAGEAGRLRASARSGQPAADRVYRAAIRLRERTYPIVRGLAEGTAPATAELEPVSDPLFSLVRKSRLTSSNGVSIAWGGAEGDLAEPLWAVAWSTLRLLRGEEEGQLRQCGNGDCTWLFLDRSRNKSRRWCAMSQCGNVLKARRHYERAKRKRFKESP